MCILNLGSKKTFMCLLFTFSVNPFSFSGPRVWENKNGGIFRPYSLKSDDLQVGDKLGMMKAPDSTLHFYLNGNDHGIGFSNLPEGTTTISIL